MTGMNTQAQHDRSIDRIGNLEIIQPKKGYRFGAEAPLLAEFIGRKRFQRGAELGAGVGVIALLVAAARRKGHIDALELQPRLAALADENVRHNGFSGRITVIEGDLRVAGETLPPGSYDLVFGNPPFRKTGSGRTSPDPERDAARRETSASLGDWLAAAGTLLKSRGRCCLVHEAGRLGEIFAVLASIGVEAKRLRFVHHGSGHTASLVLVEGIKGASPGLVIEAPDFVSSPVRRDAP